MSASGTGFLSSNFASEHWDLSQQSFKIQYLLPRGYDLHSKLIFLLSSQRIFTTLFDNKLHRKGDLKTKPVQSRASAGFQPNVLQHFISPVKQLWRDWADSTDHKSTWNHRISLWNCAEFLASNPSIPGAEVTPFLQNTEQYVHIWPLLFSSSYFAWNLLLVLGVERNCNFHGNYYSTEWILLHFSFCTEENAHTKSDNHYWVNLDCTYNHYHNRFSSFLSQPDQ